MSDVNNIPSLSDDELELLDSLLEAEAERQDSFDFFAVHGLITGLVAGPFEFNVQQVWDLAFEEQLGFSATEQQQLTTLFNNLAKEVQGWLDSGLDFPVPADLTLDDEEGEPPIESWAMGFITAVLFQDEAWYAKQEDIVAQHLFHPPPTRAAPIGAYLVLLRVEFTVPRTVASRAVRSYRTLSPLPDPVNRPSAVYSLLHWS